jgi:hypothetical protein
MSVRSSAAKKPRGKGVPFGKGDSRINRKGPLKAELQGYEIRMRNAAPSKLDADEFIGIVADEVRHHRPGAREFWGKYIVGEPAAKHDVNIRATLSMADLQKSRDEYRKACEPK